MIEPMSTIAGKVLEFLVSAFAGKEIDKLLSDRNKRKAFEKALNQALTKVAEAGFSVKGLGSLDISFLTNEVVTKELWAKLLDPTVDEEIDYELLEKALKSIYQDVLIGPREAEAIEFFVDTLMDQMWYQDPLKGLLTDKILRQHDLRLSQAKKKALIRDYLRAEGETIKSQLDEDIGEGNRYVEPLIEKSEEKKEREGKKPRERIGDKEADSFVPVDMNNYFTESSDGKVVVVADSGYGKTTLLRELFVRILRTFEAKPFVTNSPIPIYLTPSQSAGCSETNIVDKVKIRLMASGCRENKVRQFVQDEFQAGRFIFLIDALDQVLNRQNLLGALEGRCFRENRVVLTTRPNVYEMEKGHLGNYVYLRIREFDENRWKDYLGKERLDALREIVDEEFLSIPMLLRLLVEYWSSETEKAVRIRNRAELYSRMFDKLLRKQEDLDSAKAETLKKRPLSYIKSDLRKLAHDTLVKGYLGQFPRDEARDEILNEDRLNDLEARRWIFETTEHGEELAFRHRSFQEYLAAEYLKSHIKTENDLDRLESYLYHLNWEESLRFLVGLLSGKMAEGFIDRMLHPVKGEPLFLYRDHLRLAALCLREIGEAGKHQRDAVIQHLENDLQDPVLWDTAISILTTLRDVKAVNVLSDLLAHKESYVQERAAEALGEIKSERAVESLIETLKKDKNPGVRDHAASALGEIKSDKAVESLIEAFLKDEDSDVRESAVYALGAIKSEEAVELLIKALKDRASFVRWRAADALGAIKSEGAVESLIEALKNEDSGLRERAAKALGEIGSEKAAESLIRVLEDKDEASSVRGSAASYLGLIKSTGAAQFLIEALKDEASDVRKGAADALGEIKSEEAVGPLIKALGDEDSSVRRRAAEALGEFKSEEAVGPLIKALGDEASDVRRPAAEALGSIGTPKALTKLLQTWHKQGLTLDRSLLLDAIRTCDRKIRSQQPIKPIGRQFS